MKQCLPICNRQFRGMKQCLYPLVLLITLFSPSLSVDILTPTTSIKDGQYLVSEGGSFRLGFFSPNSTANRYLGIWYNKISVQTVVWVANRAHPIADFTGMLKINNSGSLILIDGTSRVFWSSASPANVSNPVAQLLDTGNLVLRSSASNDQENFAWESFNNIGDTLLPGMKLGWNLKTGLDRYLSAWKTSYDPSPGDYSFKLALRELSEFYLYRKSTKVYASGPWNGIAFSGKPEQKLTSIVKFSFISKEDEVYFAYVMKNNSTISRLRLSESGSLQRLVWIDTAQQWNVFWSDPRDQCDDYAACGPFGVCNSNESPSCNCLKGFNPKSPQNWNLRDGSDGCVRVISLECKGDGFITRSGMKLPDSTNATVNMAMNLDECRESCLKNCACMGYATANISGGGSGCIIWPSELIDLREFDVGGQDLFIRVAASELDSGIHTPANYFQEKGGSSRKKLILILILVVGIFLLVLFCLFFWKKKRKQGNINNYHSEEIYGEELELPIFDMSTIESATDAFSSNNILGEGGFGQVYKGKLGDGREIAVKRLSKDSVQGLDEFKNEVMLIAKLQHRNLVRLLGCCIQGEEWMLIYEYMQNKSLDAFIFDKAKGSLLDWRKRLDIIMGIARGLLYLHQDSRYNIIHRDLKAGNILLDKDMNPKISDFGTARMFKGDKMQENTKRVVGTYGYMSPEYAISGMYSVKSDVFSFGVLVLEILSGRKNRVVYEAEPHMDLLGQAWALWTEGKSLELVDESLYCPCPKFEILRCIQVALLCVQERMADRPTMSSVVLMLGSESVALPQPKRPGFCMRRSAIESNSSSTDQSLCTVNEVTITVVDGR